MHSKNPKSAQNKLILNSASKILLFHIIHKRIKTRAICLTLIFMLVPFSSVSAGSFPPRIPPDGDITPFRTEGCIGTVAYIGHVDDETTAADLSQDYCSQHPTLQSHSRCYSKVADFGDCQYRDDCIAGDMLYTTELGISCPNNQQTNPQPPSPPSTNPRVK